MKKFTYALGVLTISSTLLMGCSSDKEEPKNNSKEVTSEVKKVEPATKEAYQNDDKKIEQEWREYHSPLLLAFSKTMKDFSKQFIDAGQDPNLVKTKEWQDKVGTLLGEMSYEVRELKGYDGQIPKGFEEIHANLTLSMNEYQYVVDNMPAAVALLAVGGDTSLLDKCSAKLVQGTEKMNKANELLDKVNAK